MSDNVAIVVDLPSVIFTIKTRLVLDCGKRSVIVLYEMGCEIHFM
jgi:hypothetical protein